MPRSLFNPAEIESSIRRLSSARGQAFTYFYRYLLDPKTIQSIQPPSGRPWALKNLRSDLSTWRSGLSQVPADRLLTISWLSLLVMTREDLIPLSDEARIATLFENFRLFTTQLRPEGLHLGSYHAFGLLPDSEPAFTSGPQNSPLSAQPDIVDEFAAQEHRLELEERLRKLRREENTLSTRSRIPAMANDRLFAELASIQEQIQSIEKELHS